MCELISSLVQFTMTTDKESSKKNVNTPKRPKGFVSAMDMPGSCVVERLSGCKAIQEERVFQNTW